MKRQKRDKSSRVFTRGYHAGVGGRSKDSCPYTEIDSKQAWLSGWREGRTDQWSGYTGVSGIHKIANL